MTLTLSSDIFDRTRYVIIEMSLLIPLSPSLISLRRAGLRKAFLGVQLAAAPEGRKRKVILNGKKQRRCTHDAYFASTGRCIPCIHPFVHGSYVHIDGRTDRRTDRRTNRPSERASERPSSVDVPRARSGIAVEGSPTAVSQSVSQSVS